MINNPPKMYYIFKIVRVIFGLFIFALLGGMIWRGLIAVSSEYAYINADMVTLRSPIGGKVVMDDQKPGMPMIAHRPLFKIENAYWGDTQIYSQTQDLRNIRDKLSQALIADLSQKEKYILQVARLKTIKASIAQVEYQDAVISLKSLNASISKTESLLRSVNYRLTESESQLGLQKSFQFIPSFNGIIWTVSPVHFGLVKPGDDVCQVVNTNRIYVDAFFSESKAKYLLPGKIIKVKLVDDSKTWNGHIEFIRSGSGRIEYSSPIAIPPSVMKKRLVTVRIRVDWDGYFSSKTLYGIGRSVVVTFQ